jgi:hypothetical protein
MKIRDVCKNWGALLATMVLASLVTGQAVAQQTGTITSIQVVSTGTTANDGVLVLGNFSPTSGCTENGFLVVSTDDYFSQTVAMLYAAKATGASIQWTFVYCITSGPFTGYARAHAYIWQ